MKPQNQPLSIDAGSYAASYHRDESGHFLYMRRIVKPSTSLVQRDVFGAWWVLSKGVLKPGQLSVRRGNEIVPVVGQVGVFVPPFSIIEWIIQPQPFFFDTAYSTAPLPQTSVQGAFVFPVSDLEMPKNLNEAVSILSNAFPATEISQGNNPCSLSRRARARIIKTYSESISIGQIAAELVVTPSALTRSFKKDFGMAPVVYRNKLRIFDALRLLQMENYMVSQTSDAVGFEDLSRFNRHFHKEFKQSPSKFRF